MKIPLNINKMVLIKNLNGIGIFFSAAIYFGLIEVSSGETEQYCVMGGKCGEMLNGFGLKLPVPCHLERSPKNIPNNNSEAIDMLTTYLPEYFHNESSLLCCDAQQVLDIKKQIQIARTLFSRCPSCFFNFARIFLMMACSPYQSSFIKVTKTNKSSNAIEEIVYSLTEKQANITFNSCLDVQMPNGGVKVLPKIMCNMTSINDTCTKEKFYFFLGEKGNSPFQTNFSFVPHSFNIPAYNCFEKPGLYSDTTCSCFDCSALVCPQPKPFPGESKPWMVFGLNGVALIMTLVYIVILIVTVASFVFYKRFLKVDNCSEAIIVNQLAKNSVDDVSRQSKFHEKLSYYFGLYGRLCVFKPYNLLLPLSGLILASLLSSGFSKFDPLTDPIELWSAKNSRVRKEKNFYDESFGPFFRIENIVLTPTYQKPINYKNITFGPVFNQTILLKLYDLQKKILNLEINDSENSGKKLSVKDLCFSPLNKDCMIQSVLGWFQDDPSLINRTDYLERIKYCVVNPFQASSQAIRCLATYGGPIIPNIALADYQGKDYYYAKSLVFTLTLKNSINAKDNVNAKRWEKKFLNLLKSYNDSAISLAFYSERSIEDELDRLSHSNVAVVAISYIVMFLYVAISLGNFVSFQRLFVDSKIVLGFLGVVIVLLSVFSSIGLMCYLGYRSTLIIIEVIPFLVLAVGVDNIFILVQHFDRVSLKSDSFSEDEALKYRMKEMMASVAPSILLAVCAECSCFFLGALTTMPAVHIFAINAGLALLMSFILQMLIFVPILAFDIKRQQQNRYEILYCLKSKKSLDNHEEVSQSSKSFLLTFFKEIFAPFLMKNWVRFCVVLIFSAWFCISCAVIPQIDVGLEQKYSMPSDSYVLEFFDAQINKLKVGPPVYFVLKGNFNYSKHQDFLCSNAYCSSLSMVNMISQAANQSDKSYIVSSTPNSWIDDYISWASSDNCCRVFSSNKTFCPSTFNGDCEYCDISCLTDNIYYDDWCPTHKNQLKIEEFASKFLDAFLHDMPNSNCPVGGGPSYSHALSKRKSKNGDSFIIDASYFMTYHNPLQHSKDFTRALEMARLISSNVADSLNSLLKEIDSTSSPIEVFPYSFFYVFYEQYLTIWRDSLINISLALLAIFVVTFLFLSFNLVASLIIVVTIISIIINLLGLMYFWNISLNAVSLVNLVMSIGISVEFCAHIARAITLSSHQSNVARATQGLADMGSSVMSGITMTKFLGIMILAFSPSKIFQIFYFRMFFGIVVIGAVHGLILMPVLFSVVCSSFKPRFLFFWRS